MFSDVWVSNDNDHRSPTPDEPMGQILEEQEQTEPIPEAPNPQTENKDQEPPTEQPDENNHTVTDLLDSEQIEFDDEEQSKADNNGTGFCLKWLNRNI